MLQHSTSLHFLDAEKENENLTLTQVEKAVSKNQSKLPHDVDIHASNLFGDL